MNIGCDRTSDRFLNASQNIESLIETRPPVRPATRPIGLVKRCLEHVLDPQRLARRSHRSCDLQAQVERLYDAWSCDEHHRLIATTRDTADTDRRNLHGACATMRIGTGWGRVAGG